MKDIIADLKGFLRDKAFLEEGADLGRNESFTETGMINSIGVLQLLDHIEEEYDLEIPLELVTLENFDTLGAIESLIIELCRKKQADTKQE